MPKTVEITKFSGKADDFFLWKERFRNNMEILKLGYLLDKNFEYNEKKEEDIAGNRLLMAYIKSAMNDGHLTKLVSFQHDGLKAWKWLVNFYERKDLIYASVLRQKLMTLKYQEGENVEDFLSTVKVLKTQIEKIEGAKMSDGVVIGAILKGLPEFFRSFARDFSRKRDGSTIDELELELISMIKFERDSEDIPGTNAEYMLNVKKFREGKSKTTEKRKFICWKCGEEGHKRSLCPNKSKINTQKQQEKANISKEEISSESISSAIVFMAENVLESISSESNKQSSNNSVWIVDSGATSHMCHNLELFTQLEKKDFGNIIEVANGEKLSIKGSSYIGSS